MKWIVSVQFSRAKAYHNFMSLLNRNLIKDTKRINYDVNLLIVEFETTTEPEEDKICKMGNVVNVKIVEVK